MVDTCTGALVADHDLDVGFGAQCAVPPAVGGRRAYVAISGAVGTVDSGGQNRIVILDVNSPGAPAVLPQSYLV